MVSGSTGKERENMVNYEKPVILANEDVSEGVYTASGDDGGSDEDCYSVTAYIHQWPETGRGDYRIQVNGVHAAGNGHHSGNQKLELNFNLPVIYKGSNGTLISGSGSSSILIDYYYHNNGNDNIGLGDVIVEAEAGLADPDAALYCNYDCGQH